AITYLSVVISRGGAVPWRVRWSRLLRYTNLSAVVVLCDEET
ncbi:unnamed protein product, partial [Amoebophrya sp. A25]